MAIGLLDHLPRGHAIEGGAASPPPPGSRTNSSHGATGSWEAVPATQTETDLRAGLTGGGRDEGRGHTALQRTPQTVLSGPAT